MFSARPSAHAPAPNASRNMPRRTLIRKRLEALEIKSQRMGMPRPKRRRCRNRRAPELSTATATMPASAGEGPVAHDIGFDRRNSDRRRIANQLPSQRPTRKLRPHCSQTLGMWSRKTHRDCPQADRLCGFMSGLFAPARTRVLALLSWSVEGGLGTRSREFLSGPLKAQPPNQSIASFAELLANQCDPCPHRFRD